MGNKEYIERGALLMTPPFTKFGAYSTWYGEGYLDCAEEARKAVNNAPAADVVEVKYGAWVKRSNERKCSCCGFTYFNNNDEFNYCPHCGADMIGEQIVGERNEQT